MPCYRPLEAWKCAGGAVSFSHKPDSIYSLQLACGQCVGCRLERSRQWAVRCMHEAKCHETSCMVTLTYDDKHLPADGSLRYSDFQSFMRRVRKSSSNRVRFYMAGEYGERTCRPHFHALLFGLDFPDREFFFFSGSGAKIFKSARLSSLWSAGFSSVGDVTFESAAYVARYVMKKITGPAAVDHYRRVDGSTGEVVDLVPEFNRMSLKPGIGGLWLDRFLGDVFPHDRCVVRGREAKPPKYYFRRLESQQPELYAALVRKRRRECVRNSAERKPERLAAREVVATAQVKMLRRNVE